jgi:hypothetical protein
MSISLAESRPHQSLSAWLVGQLIHQEINSFEALLNVARERDEYQRDKEVGAIVTAKVWQDRGKLLGYVSEYECRLRMTTDRRRGANAILACLPNLTPGVRSESGYFRSLSRRCGDGTEGEVDGGDHRLLA